MKASHGLPLLMFLILIVIVPTCHCSIVTSWGGPGSLERYILDAFQLMKTLAMHAWRIFFTRSMLIKALPKVVDFLPTVAKDFITNTIDFLVEYGKWFVDWIDPSATIIEISERTLTNSFIGRLVYRDIIDYGLQLMRVPKNCQTKAACELGAYVLHRNQRVAGFLKAMRAHFSKISMHWPAMMNGLRGEICEELYSSCPQNFIMAKPQSRLQRPKKNENKNVKSSTRANNSRSSNNSGSSYKYSLKSNKNSHSSSNDSNSPNSSNNSHSLKNSNNNNNPKTITTDLRTAPATTPKIARTIPTTTTPETAAETTATERNNKERDSQSP